MNTLYIICFGLGLIGWSNSMVARVDRVHGSELGEVLLRIEAARHHAVLEQVVQEASFPRSSLSSDSTVKASHAQSVSELIVAACEYEFQMIVETENWNSLVSRLQRLARVASILSEKGGYFNDLGAVGASEAVIIGVQYALTFENRRLDQLREILATCRGVSVTPKNWLIARVDEDPALKKIDQSLRALPEDYSFFQILWIVRKDFEGLRSKSIGELIEHPDYLELGTRVGFVDFFLRSVLPMAIDFVDLGGNLKADPLRRGADAWGLLRNSIDEYTHYYKGGPANPSDIWRGVDRVTSPEKRRAYRKRHFGVKEGGS